MNGNSGIVPTVDLATNNNNGFAYPVMPMMGGYGYGNGGYGSDADGEYFLIKSGTRAYLDYKMFMAGTESVTT